jgi:hypothetical protein
MDDFKIGDKVRAKEDYTDTVVGITISTRAVGIITWISPDKDSCYVDYEISGIIFHMIVNGGISEYIERNV